MRKPITLVHNGEPYEIADLQTGDEILFDPVSGEIYYIIDSEGNVKLNAKEIEGKPGRMVVASR